MDQWPCGKSTQLSRTLPLEQTLLLATCIRCHVVLLGGSSTCSWHSCHVAFGAAGADIGLVHGFLSPGADNMRVKVLLGTLPVPD